MQAKFAFIRYKKQVEQAKSWNQWLPSKPIPSEISKQAALTRQGYRIPKQILPTWLELELRNHFTVSPCLKQSSPSGSPVRFNIFAESQDFLYFPRHESLRLFGPAASDNLQIRIQSTVIHPPSLIVQPRPIQQEAINLLMPALQQFKGGIICGKCGFGKTILTIIVCLQYLKLKTLVVVHTGFLMKQWKDQFEACCPGIRIGSIRGTDLDINDKDVVIATLQSLSSKSFPRSVYEQFGTVVFDEAHHLGAEVFSRALLRCGSPYFIGLTATPERKDALDFVFIAHIGPIVYRQSSRNIQGVVSHVLQLNTSIDPIFDKKGSIVYHNIIKQIYTHPRRNLFISKVIRFLLSSQRNILVLSERIEHLHLLRKLIPLSDTDIVFYIGGIKDDDIERAKSVRLVFGSYQMASEGMDLPHLNTVIFATSQTDVEQASGRILRKISVDHSPIIIDIYDKNLLMSQKNNRVKWYKHENYAVHSSKIDLDDPDPELSFLIHSRNPEFDHDHDHDHDLEPEIGTTPDIFQ